MPFSYYHRLTANQKKIYRRSDEIAVIHLPRDKSFSSLVEELARTLKQEDREKAQTQAQSLSNAITDGLHVPRVRVKVLQTRPSNEEGELHGLYNPKEQQKGPRVTLWMRTAKTPSGCGVSNVFYVRCFMSYVITSITPYWVSRKLFTLKGFTNVSRVSFISYFHKTNIHSQKPLETLKVRNTDESEKVNSRKGRNT